MSTLSTQLDIIQQYSEISATILGVVGGLLAAAFGLFQYWRVRVDKKTEFHWQKSKLSREIHDVCWSDYKSWAAMQMIDISGRTYRIDEQRTLIVTQDLLIQAIDINTNPSLNEDIIWIRDCMDSFFLHIGRMEGYIRNALMSEEDIEHFIRYYVNRIKTNCIENEIVSYMRCFGLCEALSFCRRVWKTSSEIDLNLQDT